MNKLKKGIIIGVATLTLTAGSLYSVSKFGATDSWVNNILIDVQNGLQSAGQNKTKQLLTDTNIEGEMKNVLTPEINAKQSELERLLEEYYRMKVEGLTDSADFKLVQTRINNIMNTTLAKYKAEIDAEFAR